MYMLQRVHTGFSLYAVWSVYTVQCTYWLHLHNTVYILNVCLYSVHSRCTLYNVDSWCTLYCVHSRCTLYRIHSRCTQYSVHSRCRVQCKVEEDKSTFLCLCLFVQWILFFSGCPENLIWTCVVYVQRSLQSTLYSYTKYMLDKATTREVLDPLRSPRQGLSGAFKGTWNCHKTELFSLNPQLSKLQPPQQEKPLKYCTLWLLADRFLRFEC